MKTSTSWLSAIEILEARIAPASYVWNLTGSGNWNNAANWINEATGTTNNGFPNAVDDVAKFLTAATANATVTIAGVNVTAGSLIFDDNNLYNIAASGGGSLTLNGSAGATITVTGVNGNPNHTISAPLNLGSALTIDHSSAGVFSFTGTISEGGTPRNVTKAGSGQFTFNPSAAFTLSGTLAVHAGIFSFSGINTTLTGPVIIGGAGTAAELRNLGFTIADTAPVTVNALGTLTSLGTDTIGALTVNDGTVALTTGNLTVASLAMSGGSVQLNTGRSLLLNGNVTATASASSAAQITGGTLGLNGAVRTFDIDPGPQAPTMTITATISGGAGSGLVKTGAGSLQIAGASSNNTPAGMTVNEGLLLFAKPAAITANSGNLIIGDGVGGADADGVRVFGSNQTIGTVVTVNSSGLLDLNGSSAQIGILSLAGGHVTTGTTAADLRIANSTALRGGLIEAEAVGSRIFLPAAPAVSSDASTTTVIDGLGSVEAFNSTSINFNVVNTTLEVALAVLVPITGAGTSVTKSGAGTLALDGANTYGGSTTINAGTLSVGGSIGAVNLANFSTRLTGSGSTGAITGNAGQISSDSLSTGSLAMTGPILTVYNLHLDGTTPGDGPGFYDQLSVTGTVDLTFASLQLTGAPVFSSGQTVVLIDNDGTDAVTGEFNGLPEGTTFFTAAGRDFVISYVGGDGNDVVLYPKVYFTIEGGTAPDGDDIYVIRRDGTDQRLLHVTVQTGITTQLVDVSLDQFSGVLFRGGLGNDTVIFDGQFGYFTSVFPFTDEIIFDGGPGANSLRLNTGAGLPTVGTATFTPAGGDGGSLQLGNGFAVSFTGVGDFFSALPVDGFELAGRIGVTDDIALVPGTADEEVVLDVAGRVPVTLRNAAVIALNGAGGADTYRIGAFAAAAGIDSIEIPIFGNTTATLTVEGGDANDLFMFNAATNTITRTGQPTITSTAALATVFEGRSGNDELQITNGSALGTTFLGGAGSDTLSFASSSSAVGFNADLLGIAQTLNGSGWSLTLGDVVENFVGSPAADQITLAPGTTPRSVSDPNGTGTLILDGLGSALTVTGPLLNNASGTVTLAGLTDPTFNYDNVGLVRLIRTPNANPAFGTTGNTFAAPLDFDTAKGAVSLATADLNGDGRADFVTAHPKTGNLSIALSTPTGLLLPAVQKLTGGKKPTGLVIGNFDGLNGLDIAVTNAGSGNVAILLNDGTGNFGNPTVFATGKTPGLLRANDLDGDGDLDLATFIAGNKLAILKGNGDGTFAAATTLATGSVKPRDLALVDLDGDNDNDLTVLHTGGQLATLLNDGTASFATPTIAKAGAGATALAIADFNGDGRLDAAVTHSVTSRFVAILLGQGTGAFFPALKIAYPLGAKASAVVASDFDGDGRTDLAIANGAGGRVSILRGLGNGGFARALDLTLEDTPPRKLVALALGDFDGDGRDDLASLSSGSGEVSLVTRA